MGRDQKERLRNVENIYVFILVINCVIIKTFMPARRNIFTSPLKQSEEKPQRRGKSFTSLSISCLSLFSFSLEICQLCQHMTVFHQRRLLKMSPRIDAKISKRREAKICTTVQDTNFLLKINVNGCSVPWITWRTIPISCGKCTQWEEKNKKQK